MKNINRTKCSSLDEHSIGDYKMAKIRRYRKYRKSKKWSANFQEILGDNIPVAGATVFQYNQRLCTNYWRPEDPTAITTQMFTVKNIEYNGTVTISSNEGAIGNTIQDMAVFIMFVPQGMTVDPTYPSKHPEYILAMKYFGKPSSENIGLNYSNPIKVKTRLARKLQTGDSIILLATGYNPNSSNSYTIRVSGIVRWFSKGN